MTHESQMIENQIMSKQSIVRRRLASAEFKIAFALGCAACSCAMVVNPVAAHVRGDGVRQGQQRAAPDDSTVTITTREGTRTETRVFNNPASRVARVVRTTAADGTRTTRVYYRDNSVRQLNASAEDSALEATDDALADLAGSSLDVTREEAAPLNADEPRSVPNDASGASSVNEGAGAVRPRTVTGVKAASTAATETSGASSGNIVEQAGDKIEDGASAAKRGAGKAIGKGAEAAGAGANRAKDAARDAAGDAAGVAGRAGKGTARVAAKATVRGAAEVGEATGDAARATGGGIGRGLRRIGRKVKSIFGS